MQVEIAIPVLNEERTLKTNVEAVLASHSLDERIDCDPSRVWRNGTEDAQGWLAHPYIVGLEVTPLA